MKLSRKKSKCAVSEREIFLEKEKKIPCTLYKQLKPAAYLRFRISRAITFAFGFHGVSVLVLELALLAHSLLMLYIRLGRRIYVHLFVRSCVFHITLSSIETKDS